LNKKAGWARYSYIAGVIALLGGAFDPMEGAAIIAGGSILIALATAYAKDRNRITFIATAAMITFGVFSLFYASSLGGFDPKHEWWWLILIFPYPIGWLINVITLIIRLFTKPKPATVN